MTESESTETFSELKKNGLIVELISNVRFL